MPVKHGPKRLVASSTELTQQQRIALSNPCETPYQCNQERYLAHEVRLTFDLFGCKPVIEGPCWHASVAEHLFPTRSTALYALYRALDGVGHSKTFQVAGGGFLRARRAATLAEVGASARATEARHGGKR